MKHLVVVYGSLKKGFYNHRVMDNSLLLGEVIVPNFEMYSMGSFPAIIKGDGEILGEVYEVNNRHTLQKIYNLESYTGERNNPNNWYDTCDVDTDFGKAEIFYMRNKNSLNSNNRIKDGFWDIEYQNN